VALNIDYVEDPIDHLVAITIDIQAAAVVIMHQQTLIDSPQYIGIPAPPSSDLLQTWRLNAENTQREIWSQSYAFVKSNPTDTGTPIFLAGGQKEFLGEIYRSTDGVNWTIVHSSTLFFGPDSEQAGASRGVERLLWHATDHKFYALFRGGSTSLGPDNPTPHGGIVWKILGSTDGTSWEEESGPYTDDVSADTAFKALCFSSGKPENSRLGEPDGINGYDPGKKLLIMGFDDHIVIERDGIPEDGGDGLPSSGVSWISFAGGIWNALSWRWQEVADPINAPTEIYASSDDGQTWQQQFATTGGSVAGLSAGALSEITGEPT